MQLLRSIESLLLGIQLARRNCTINICYLLISALTVANRPTKKMKNTLAIEADLFEVGYEVAMAKANMQLPRLLKVRHHRRLKVI